MSLSSRRPLMGWPGRAQRLICWTVAGRREATLMEHAMRTSRKTAGIITTIGIDLGKNTFRPLVWLRSGNNLWAHSEGVMLRRKVLTGVSACLVVLGAAAAQAERTRGIVAYDDVRIEVIAEGSGSLVVLLPSRGRDSEDFDEVAAGIAKAGYRVLRPQPRGTCR